MGEEACQIYKGQAPRVLAVLRNGLLRLLRHLAQFGDLSLALTTEYLPNACKVQIIVQGGAGLQGSRFEAAMTFLTRPMALIPGGFLGWQPHRLLKHKVDRLVEFALILLDDHPIMAVLSHNLFGRRAASMERIHRRHGAGQVAVGQEFSRRLDFMAFVLNGPLGAHRTRAMLHQADEP